jgi:hypothetical protein
MNGLCDDFYRDFKKLAIVPDSFIPNGTELARWVELINPVKHY